MTVYEKSKRWRRPSKFVRSVELAYPHVRISAALQSLPHFDEVPLNYGCIEWELQTLLLVEIGAQFNESV